MLKIKYLNALQDKILAVERF